MIQPRRKRVYDRVEVAQEADGYGILLDGKPLRTPAKAPLRVPGRRLAEAIAAEWAAQGAELDPAAMPLTRLAGSAIDLVGPNRPEIVSRTAAYAATDLLCYRAEAPPELVERQDAAWQPILDWLAQRYGAVLRVTQGIMAVEQPAEALTALRSPVEAADNLRLTALAALAAACGSLAIALGVAEGRLDAEAAWALSQLDETYQIEQWGEDAEAASRRAALRAEIAAAAQFLALLAA
ncbi:MAG TPA: ATP12 family protein [Alphaproteobacteria bacterium]|nr:ATP12 family protein [Alphaproteobacteria bacterium]